MKMIILIKITRRALFALRDSNDEQPYSLNDTVLLLWLIDVAIVPYESEVKTYFAEFSLCSDQ